jgi:hypothetical protein
MNTMKASTRTADVAIEIRTWDLADKKQDGEPLHSIQAVSNAVNRIILGPHWGLTPARDTTRTTKFTPVDRCLRM